MKKILRGAFLGTFLFLAGCSMLDFLTHPQKEEATGKTEIPIVKLATDVGSAALSGWAEGGIIFAVVGAAATFFKSGARVYADYAKKTAVKAP